jgi:hypothetical protein
MDMAIASSATEQVFSMSQPSLCSENVSLQSSNVSWQ